MHRWRHDGDHGAGVAQPGPRAGPAGGHDAVATGVARATETLRGVSGAWVKDHKVSVKDNKIVSWQVNMMVTVVLDD